MARGDGPIGHQSRFEGFVASFHQKRAYGFLYEKGRGGGTLHGETFQRGGFPMPTAGAWIEGWLHGPARSRRVDEIEVFKPWDEPDVVALREARFAEAQDNAKWRHGRVSTICKGVLFLRRQRADGIFERCQFYLNGSRYGDNDVKDGLSFEDLGWVKDGMNVRVKHGISWSGLVVLAVEPDNG